jgi:hypothetical protein
MSVKNNPALASSVAGWLRDLANAGGTGGLNWHVHAARSLQRWLPTRELIAAFLAQVNTPHKHLLLIGCSAGWMLPTPWLSRFECIDVYDIDPLVPVLFGLRHGRDLKKQGITLRYHRQDAIAGLPALLKQHPQACVWFDNVLGQVSFRLGDEDIAERQLSQLRHWLAGRSWGSLHDVYSGPIDQDMPVPAYDTLSWTRLDDLPEATSKVRIGEQVCQHEEAAQVLLGKLHAKGVWHDHVTRTVFAPGTATTMIPWAFRPMYWHCLQAAWVRP